MAVSREGAREGHAQQTGHDQFSDTIYGLICAACRNYVLIDKTNCASSCREHESCQQAYA